jgi:predicted  nucleic acid-binding Zn-ribbon protein
MIVELEYLIALRDRDMEIRALNNRLKLIPEEIDALEKEIAKERAHATLATNNLNESLKIRKAAEKELALVESRIAKYKDQLMDVKTNDEYRAMQKQIENAKEEASATEDKILVQMEEAERLQTDLDKRQSELKEAQDRVKKRQAELEDEASGLRAELDRRSDQRKSLLELLPENLLGKYRRVARLRGGVAVAEAKDEHCQVCNVRLRPQVYSEIRLGNKILQCDSCSRILYYVGPPPGQTDLQPEEKKGDREI